MDQIAEGKRERNLLMHRHFLAFDQHMLNAIGRAVMNEMRARHDIGCGSQAAKHIIRGRSHDGIAERRLHQGGACTEGRKHVLLHLIGVV